MIYIYICMCIWSKHYSIPLPFSTHVLCFTPATLHRPKPRTAASHAPWIPCCARSPVHRRFWIHAALPRNERLPAEAPGGFHLPRWGTPGFGWDSRWPQNVSRSSWWWRGFPILRGGGRSNIYGFFCSYHLGKKCGLCNHLQIFSYTSLFLYSDHVVFDTCVPSPLYAQIHLDLHTSIVVCNAAECTYASRSAYAYRRLRAYTVYSMECKNSECIIWGT